MDTAIARCSVMPGKDDDSLSPYLRKPLRTYEDATREQASRPDPGKSSTEPPSKRDDRT